jgi:hypothetical protein
MKTEKSIGATANKQTRRQFIFSSLLLMMAAVALPTRALAGYVVLSWNNLGMHCMDADYSVFTILPPYNTIHSQVVDSQGHLLTAPGSVTVRYQALADPDGSINTTSVGKTNFWQFMQALFGVSLPADVGLPVPGPDSFSMPPARDQTPDRRPAGSTTRTASVIIDSTS